MTALTRITGFMSKWNPKTVAALLADTRTYTEFSENDLVETEEEGFRYKVAATGASDYHVITAGGVKFDCLSSLVTPVGLGYTMAGALGVDQNLIVGGYGTWDTSGGSVSRPSWDISSTPSPVSDFDLDITGHFIHADVNSAVIIGGRSSYYSAVQEDASLSLTYGGDCINNHLAGMNLAMHSDLIEDDLARGSHGAVFGGSWKRVSSDYAGSFAGTIHDIHGLQSVALGGSSIQIGSMTDSAVVRRGGILGGYLLEMTAGYQSVMLGGESNTHTAGDNGAIIGGDNNEIDNTEHGLIAASQHSKVTADRGIVLGSTFAVGNVVNAITRSVGRDTNEGDSQTHHIEIRRTSVGPNLYPSVTGGSGTELFTPPANTVGAVRLLLSAQEKQTTSDNGAAYEIKFSFSNIGGTLSIKAQTLTIIHEDDSAWDCSAVLTGGSTRIAVVIQTNGDTGTFLVTGTGEIVMQTVA